MPINQGTNTNSSIADSNANVIDELARSLLGENSDSNPAPESNPKDGATDSNQPIPQYQPRDAEEIIKESYKRLPAKIRKQVGGELSNDLEIVDKFIMKISGLLFGDAYKNFWDKRWGKYRDSYYGWGFKQYGWLVNHISLGMLISTRGTIDWKMVVRQEYIRRRIMEEVQKYDSMQMSSGDRYKLFYKPFLRSKNKIQALAALTSIALSSELSEKRVEEFYEAFGRKKPMFCQYEIKDRNGETKTVTVPLTDENGKQVVHYSGDISDFMIEVSIRRDAGTKGKRFDTMSGGLRKKITSKDGKLIGVGIVTLEEMLKSADEYIKGGSGRRAESSMEMDVSMRYADTKEVEDAVYFLGEQVKRYNAWLSDPNYSPQEKARMEQIIEETNNEIRALSVKDDGQTDYGAGVGRVKSIMLDWSHQRPHYEGEEAQRQRFINFAKGPNGKHIWEVGAHPYYTKWLASFDPRIVMEQIHLLGTTLQNFEDLLAEDRIGAFRQRVQDKEYGARDLRGRVDKRKEDFVDQLEQSNLSDRLSSSESLSLDLLADEGVEGILNDVNLRSVNSRREAYERLASKKILTEKAEGEISRAVREMTHYLRSVGKENLAEQLASEGERFLKRLWVEHDGDLLIDLISGLQSTQIEKLSQFKGTFERGWKVRKTLEKQANGWEAIFKAEKLLSDKPLQERIATSQATQQKIEQTTKSFLALDKTSSPDLRQVSEFLQDNRHNLYFAPEDFAKLATKLKTGEVSPRQAIEEIRPYLLRLRFQILDNPERELGEALDLDAIIAKLPALFDLKLYGKEFATSILAYSRDITSPDPKSLVGADDEQIQTAIMRNLQHYMEENASPNSRKPSIIGKLRSIAPSRKETAKWQARQEIQTRIRASRGWS